jgi:N-terminal domain of CBF1 interacting co-repressor CIR/Pre-mRNA splicing factor
MVQGLAFLSKKSWHTKNIANQERVWIEEQKKAAEDSKTRELAKQIQREREEEDLDRIAGRKSNRLDRGIDWMYQGVTSEASKEDAKKLAEEYLLGKEFNDAKFVPQKGDLVEEEMHGYHKIIPKLDTDNTPSSMSKPSGATVAERNEAYRIQHEDPMFIINQKRQEKELKIQKTKHLYAKVLGEPVIEQEEELKIKKRKSKDRKREKKRHKKEGKKSDYSHRKSHQDSDSEGSVRFRKIESRSSENEMMHKLGHDGTRDSNYDAKNNGSLKQNIPSYGLKGPSRSLNLSDLKPSSDFVAQRLQAREKRKSNQVYSNHHCRYTAEEREKARKEMQLDAMKYETSRVIQKPTQEEDERKSAAFLHDIARQTHGIHGNQRSMAERVVQNRHNNQRLTDSL